MNERSKFTPTNRREIKRKKYARSIIQKEINEIKSDVREAYSIAAQINTNENFKPSPEELEKLEEQPMNLKLIKKLERMREKISDELNTEPEHRRNLQGKVSFESKNLLHFFYIVRLAQQGFFYLVSGLFPALEPQAITYVCDTMISSNIRSARSASATERNFYAKLAGDLCNGLIDEKDEPVAKGFRTTFKDIMDAAHDLMDRSICQHKNKTPQHNSNTNSIQPPQPTPPVWFVMPYTSMIDMNNFAVPGSVPTVPYPEELVPNGMMPENVHSSYIPRVNPANRLRRRYEEQISSSIIEKDESKDNVEEKGTNEKEESNEKDNNQEQEQEQEDSSEQESEVDDTENSDQEHDYSKRVHDNSDFDDNDDRFADPDITVDEEDEYDKEEDYVRSDDENLAEVNQDQFVENGSSSKKDDNEENEAVKANKSWQTFAASSRNSESSSSFSSPKSKFQRYYKPKQY